MVLLLIPLVYKRLGCEYIQHYDRDAISEGGQSLLSGAVSYCATVNFLILHNVIMHKSITAWGSHRSHRGTQGSGVHNA